MNDAQIRKYRYEWKLTRRWFREHGLTPQQADAKRHEIHRAELGRDKSSLDFTNDDLTKVLRAFAAVHDGGNLNAQMRANDDPVRRRLALRERCYRAVETFITDPIEARRSLAIENYVGGTAQRMCGKRFDELDERELGKVMGALERSARVRAGHRSAEQEAGRLMAADKEPF